MPTGRWDKRIGRGLDCRQKYLRKEVTEYELVEMNCPSNGAEYLLADLMTSVLHSSQHKPLAPFSLFLSLSCNPDADTALLDHEAEGLTCRAGRVGSSLGPQDSIKSPHISRLYSSER